MKIKAKGVTANIRVWAIVEGNSGGSSNIRNCLLLFFVSISKGTTSERPAEQFPDPAKAGQRKKDLFKDSSDIRTAFTGIDLRG
jgi:hypothetical protein